METQKEVRKEFVWYVLLSNLLITLTKNLMSEHYPQVRKGYGINLFPQKLQSVFFVLMEFFIFAD